MPRSWCFLRYRFTLFNTTYDRRDVKLDRYLPTRRAYFVAFVLWAMVGVASIITSAPSESGVAKYLHGATVGRKSER